MSAPDLLPIHQLTPNKVVEYLKRITDLGDAFELRDVPKKGNEALDMLDAQIDFAQTAEMKPKMSLYCIPGEFAKKSLVRPVYQRIAAEINKLRQFPLTILQPPGCGNSSLVYYFFCCCFQGVITPGGLFYSSFGGRWLVTKSFVALVPDDENTAPKVIATKPAGTTTIPPFRNYIAFIDLYDELPTHIDLDDPVVICTSFENLHQLTGIERLMIQVLPSWSNEELKLATFWCHSKWAKRDAKKLLNRAAVYGLNLKLLYKPELYDEAPRLETADNLQKFIDANASLFVKHLLPGTTELKSRCCLWKWKSHKCAELGRSWLQSHNVSEDDLWAAIQLPNDGYLQPEVQATQLNLSPLEETVHIPSPPPANISPDLFTHKQIPALTPIAEEVSEEQAGDSGTCEQSTPTCSRASSLSKEEIVVGTDTKSPLCQPLEPETSPATVSCAVIIESDSDIDMAQLDEPKQDQEAGSVVRNLVKIWEAATSPLKDTGVKESKPYLTRRRKSIRGSSATQSNVDYEVTLCELPAANSKKRRCSSERLVLTQQSAPPAPSDCLFNLSGDDNVSFLENDIRILKQQMELAARQWRMCEAALGTMTRRLNKLKHEKDKSEAIQELKDRD